MSTIASISAYPHHHHQQQQQFGGGVYHPTSSTAARTAETAESLLVHQQPQSRTAAAAHRSAMAAACYPATYERCTTAATPAAAAAAATPSPAKDYSRPLHVDCSVEYELPNTAKPPQGVRNEPLLMIHPCYFRKIESQRRSPFVNNLPAPAAVVPKRPAHGRQQAPQHQLQQPQLGAQYPAHYQTAYQEQSYCKRADHHHHHHHQQQQHYTAAAAAYPDCWTTAGSEPVERSPDRPDRELLTGKHLLGASGKYRQYMSRAHRLHPYGAIPLTATFPQVCYNV